MNPEAKSGQCCVLRGGVVLDRHLDRFPGGDVLHARCADIGRDPTEITLSAHLGLGPDRDYNQVIDTAAALGAEGLDLGIVYIAPPHDRAVIEPLAQAIRESGLLS